MIGNEQIIFNAIEISQPIGKFYVGCMDYRDLLYIFHVDELRIEKRDVEKYLGVERPLSEERVKEIKQYVNTIDAAFPTSIIISVSSQNATYNSDTKTMYIKRKKGVAEVIDGQHRIAGLSAYRENNFQLNVTIFIDMDLEDQAMVFATINLEQTKVNRSIAYSLYEYTKSRSPQKTCHNIAKLLNSKEGSPFKDKIKILGRATPGISGETLTQATFVKLLLPLISYNPVRDKDDLKRGKKLKRALMEEEKKRIFINMFREEHDAEIARILWNYFSAVQIKWNKAWNDARAGNILNRTAGFTALMYFLPVAYGTWGEPGKIVIVEEFSSIFNRMTLKDKDFNPDKYVPGAKGERSLYLDFCKEAGLKTTQILE
jgi:DGQHR domain-containing protein